MKKALILILGLICIMLISPFVRLSKATAYYEWVLNGSFEGYINYFEDYSAESNIFNSGVQYGNFSGTATFSLADPYIGLRHFYVQSGQTLWYNLTEPIIGADIINCSFYDYNVAGANDKTISIYYTDYTVDTYTDTYHASYTYVSILGSINDAKYVTAFKIIQTVSGGSYFDNFILYDIDDDAQDYVTFNTKPWYEPRVWSVDTFQVISTAQAYYGNRSYHDFIATGNEGYDYQGGVPLTQSFYGLDSDLVHDFRLYAMTDNEIDLTVMFLYSDETYSADTKYINASSWTLYVFDVAVPDKTVVGFRIIPYSLGTYTVNLWLDGISLTATQIFDATEVTDSDHDGIPDEYDTFDDEEWIDEEEEEEQVTNLVDWIVMFCVIFLPALLFSGGIYENNQQPDSMHISPIFGLVAGLILSVGLGFYTGLVPLWILVLMIVSVTILIVGMFKH